METVKDDCQRRRISEEQEALSGVIAGQLA